MPGSWRYCMATILVVASVWFQRTASFDLGNFMWQKMNLSADPCVDFNEFACGRFINETVLPPDKVSINPTYSLQEQNDLVVSEILREPIGPNETSYLRKMKLYYASCINDDQINAVGVTPFFNDRRFVNNWPLLNPSWDEASFSLNETLTLYASVNVEPIFSVSVRADWNNSSIHRIYLRHAHSDLNANVITKPRNSSVVMAYQRYLAEMAVILGANRTVAERDASLVVDLELALAKIHPTAAESRDTFGRNNPVTLNELPGLYPGLDIRSAIIARFNAANITLDEDEVIINEFPAFIGNILNVTQRFSNRVLQNMFFWRLAQARVGSLTTQLLDIYYDFFQAQWGITHASKRVTTCGYSTRDFFQLAVSKEFVKRTFSANAKRYVNTMIDNIIEAFRRTLVRAAWMSNETKQEAFLKLANMGRRVGYPDTGFEESDIEAAYEEYNVSADTFYHNRLLIRQLRNIKQLKHLRTPVDPTSWTAPLYDAQAYYIRSTNLIVMAAGYLQPPHFNVSYPAAVNYGRIGYVIGHEMMHGFDDEGSKYDGQARVRNWFKPSELTFFKKRLECVIGKNSEYYIPEVNKYLDGVRSQGEITADIGGLREAFRGYKQKVRRSGRLPTIPGFNVSHYNLFFLSFAQGYCEKPSNQWLNFYATSTHPPMRYRNNAAIQNAGHFPKYYNCLTRTNMHPATKCHIWSS